MVIDYSKAKLLQTAIGCPILGAVGLMLLPRVGEVAAFFVVICALCLFVISPPALFKLLGDRAALRADASGLTVATLWSRRTLNWPDILEIGTERLSFYTFFGLIRASSTDYLVVKTRGGVLGSRKIRLLSGLLEVGPRGVTEVIDRVLGARSLAPAAAPLTRRGEPLADQAKPAEFDADAAIARYLADKEMAAQLSPSLPPRPSFGRKGLTG